MTTLAETQQQLFYYLQNKTSTIESLVTGKNPSEIKRRLHIYREAYQLRLSNHLAKQFPVLRAHLQQSAFDQLAQAFLTAYPPSHFALRNFGDRMSEFLSHHAPYNEKMYLSELATLEWQLNEIIDQSATAPLLTTAHLAQVKPEDLANTCFPLQAYVRFVEFQHDLPPWRDASKKSHKSLAPPPALDKTIHYALWRKGFQTYYRPLNSTDYHLALALKAGKSFGELCALEFDHISATDMAQCVAQSLLTWVNDGWFVSFISSENNHHAPYL